jgi:hypothetical protein
MAGNAEHERAQIVGHQYASSDFASSIAAQRPK